MSTKLNVATNLAGDPVYFAFIDGDYVNFIPETPLTDAAHQLLEALVALIGALGLKLPDDELLEYYGELGLDAIRRAKAAIAAAAEEE